jgi:hemerythrin-like metal-binding protein
MHEAMKSGTSRQTLPVILKKLADYVTFHFTYEEKIMSQIAYPGTVTHMHLHQVFAKNFNKTLQEHTDGKMLISLEIMNTLRDWLIAHIMNEDKKYTEYFKKK